MRVIACTTIAAALLASPAALRDYWQHHRLATRAEHAGAALRATYVRTPAESIRIASAYEVNGKMCVMLSSSGPAFQQGDEAATTMAYAIFSEDGHTYRYNLDRSEFEVECSGADAGVNVLVATERGVAKGDQ